jgi:hypothetical protein
LSRASKNSSYHASTGILLFLCLSTGSDIAKKEPPVLFESLSAKNKYILQRTTRARQGQDKIKRRQQDKTSNCKTSKEDKNKPRQETDSHRTRLNKTRQDKQCQDKTSQPQDKTTHTTK